jgi:formylglycine-generating enzyme required for sulfatase activity
VKQFTLVLILAMAGCGEKDTLPEAKDTPPKTNDSPSESNAKPKVAVKKPEKVPEMEIPAGAFINSLGMPFVKVPGTDVQFCIWETRVKDYAAYAVASTRVEGSWKDPAYFKRNGFKQADTHPVVNVSWNNAKTFCAWLTKKELTAGKIKAGQKYRLPTDAEWSVAVGLGKEKGNTPEEKHLGIKDVCPWGKEWPPPKGAGNYIPSLKVDEFEYTAPVGSFAANQHGLYDLGGNILEWCEDKYSPNRSWRVLRGASFGNYAPADLWSSNRHYITPNIQFFFIMAGFRCVLVGGSGG